MKNYHYDKSNGIFSENIFLSIDIFFRFLRERITRSDGNLQVTDLDISIVWHRQIAQREDRIRKRPPLICLSIGGRFVFSSSEYPRSRNTTFTPIFLFFLAGSFLLPSAFLLPEEELNRKKRAKTRGRQKSERRVDRLIRLSSDISLHSRLDRLFFPSPPSSTHIETSIKPSSARKRREKKKEEKREEEGVNSSDGRSHVDVRNRTSRAYGRDQAFSQG